MGFDADVTAREPETPGDGAGMIAAVLDVTGIGDDEMGLLIGRRGETLAALQYLLNLIVNHQTRSHNVFGVDMEGYRRRRETALRELALRIADRVRAERPGDDAGADASRRAPHRAHRACRRPRRADDQHRRGRRPQGRDHAPGASRCPARPPTPRTFSSSAMSRATSSAVSASGRHRLLRRRCRGALGLRTAILTSAAADFDLPARARRRRTSTACRAAQPTVMEHRWLGARARAVPALTRRDARAPPRARGLLAARRSCCSVRWPGRSEPALVAAFPAALRGATVQGWLRRSRRRPRRGDRRRRAGELQP